MKHTDLLEKTTLKISNCNFAKIKGLIALVLYTYKVNVSGCSIAKNQHYTLKNGGVINFWENAKFSSFLRFISLLMFWPGHT